MDRGLARYNKEQSIKHPLQVDGSPLDDVEHEAPPDSSQPDLNAFVLARWYIPAVEGWV